MQCTKSKLHNIAKDNKLIAVNVFREVGVLVYSMLSGISPFYQEDEDEVIANVQRVKWGFDEDSFETVTNEAKDFIKKCLVRIPE